MATLLFFCLTSPGTTSQNPQKPHNSRVHGISANAQCLKCYIYCSPSTQALPISSAIPNLKTLNTSKPLASFTKPFLQSHALFTSPTFPPLIKMALLSVDWPSPPDPDPSIELPTRENWLEAVVRFEVDFLSIVRGEGASAPWAAARVEVKHSSH